MTDDHLVIWKQLTQTIIDDARMTVSQQYCRQAFAPAHRVASFYVHLPSHVDHVTTAVRSLISPNPLYKYLFYDN